MAATDETAYLVFDTESVVDGALVARTLYAGEGLSAEAARERLRREQLEASGGTSDFAPVGFQVPVAIGVAKVDAGFRLLSLSALDAPRCDPQEMVALFWRGVQAYRHAALVDFNGRGFDLPLLTMSAFRFGLSCPRYFDDSDRFGFRYRFSAKHIDLLEWLTEYGAFRLRGGLDLCAKLLGKPGKFNLSGEQVEALHREGRRQEIADYCLHDVLDTYFVFLRTRVLCGQLALEAEQLLVSQTRAWLAERAEKHPALGAYLERFGAWDPRPFIGSR